MYSLIVSATVATVTFLAANFALTRAAPSTPYGWLWAVLAAVATGAGVYVAIVFLVNRRFKAGLPAVEQALMGQRPDQAIQLLEGMRALGKWQPLAERMIDGQIGVIVYAYKQDPVRARPYLERTVPQNWHAKAMLGAMHFQNRDDAAMVKAFEDALKAAKSESLLWAAYAWCEWKRGHFKQAVDVLERARRALPDDERITRNLHGLQSTKKMKMNAYEPEWFLFGLQRPPPEVVTGGRRMGGHPMGTRRMVRGR